ncbi:MAG: hypothetical protein IJO46_00060, partial [Thermoguttaceae bacterium]|nr:hypothetical protein [Thermoguttaceae bacterium]
MRPGVKRRRSLARSFAKATTPFFSFFPLHSVFARRRRLTPRRDEDASRSATLMKRGIYGGSFDPVHFG